MLHHYSFSLRCRGCSDAGARWASSAARGRAEVRVDSCGAGGAPSISGKVAEEKTRLPPDNGPACCPTFDLGYM